MSRKHAFIAETAVSWAAVSTGLKSIQLRVICITVYRRQVVTDYRKKIHSRCEWRTKAGPKQKP